ncbi:hypothetical protein BV22DRAFT_719323 [Leucogyrophana mollusca]|uniref:Uncharacterized protein n=1 Tax=Leucogyrophana mollusca TaxID=85980 RepID=A0ACB8B7C6_9AGAM|nr:hypothetical protein BV22DRAFT_719323 [Leucogyrophana mollusca]
MLQLGTLYACIKVNDVALPVYDIEISEKEKKVSCWIPSEAGKTFSIVWQDTHELRNYHEGGSVTIDGIPSRGVILKPLMSGEPLSYANCTAELKYLRTSATSGRPLTFSNLKLTDDDMYLKSAPVGLGEISLTVWPVDFVCALPCRPVEGVKNQMVHERAKKAYSHCVSVGNETALPFTQELRTRRIGSEPFATFVFRYRPLDRLIADGIAPPRCSKRAMPDDFGDRDRQSDNEAMRELQALKEHVKRLEKTIIHYKRTSSKRVKAEICDEIIDLTN